MAPLNEEKPARKSKRPRDDSDDKGEGHSGANRIELDCPFQIETLRQAAFDSSSATEGMKSVYTVRPGAAWDSLSRFKSFSVNDEHFAIHDNVHITRAFTHFDRARGTRVEKEEWAARVLEIAGFDEAHVYLRVMWFYLPEELPDGREDHHGYEELIATNDMSIVDASRVNGHANIPQWIETDQDDPPNDSSSPYWRQTFDKVTGELSDLELHCICLDPQNPDDPLIRCTDPDCGVRMHRHCICDSAESDLLERHYDRRRDGARFPPGTMFSVAVVDKDPKGDPQNPDNNNDEPPHPWIEITDHRSSPPKIWEREVLCLECSQPLA
ncbi:hypothetical protein MMC07_009872 [Pseudocyphellaria aurata]|nr:hypothetical protein [Pseudocyphellaria aurata]